MSGHVAEFLKANDRDRYFASLLVEGAAGDAIQALYAFGADVATVRDRVREPAAGEIRLQWWVDALKGEGHGAVRQNPIAAALFDAVERYRLPTGPLLRLLAARRFDLYQDPMPDLQSFEGYAGETNSVLYQLAAMILNRGTEVETGDAAGHLGVAHAMIGHLRAFGLNASQGRIFLPWSIIAASGVNEREVFAGEVSEGLLHARAQFVDLAREYLDKAEAAVESLPRPLRRAFATIAILRPQLAAVDDQADNPFAPPRDIADWIKIARLGWWAWRRA